jgi:hypothetical protein
MFRGLSFSRTHSSKINIYNNVARTQEKSRPFLGSGSVNTSIARQRLCKHATIPEQSLGNGHTRNNRGTIGSGVFRAVRPEAI